MANKWAPARELNPATKNIDAWPDEEILLYFAGEVQKIHRMLRLVQPQLRAGAVEILRRVRRGGRLITIGAGGSGVAGMSVMRELPHNFGVDPEKFIYRVAGGMGIFEPLGREEMEDSWAEGEREARDLHLDQNDVLALISATGRTPYTRGAATVARVTGAFTMALLAMPDTELSAEVDLPIILDAGPEALVGATCLKASLAQQAALQAITSLVMIRLGLTRGNFIVHARLVHEKAKARRAFFEGGLSGK